MKHAIVWVSLATATLLGNAAWAAEGSSCHFHGNQPVAEATVVDCAGQRKAQLVKTGKLDGSWQAVKHDQLEQVDGKKGKEWRLMFKNPAKKDPAKATLYMFYAPSGNFIAANFTGK